MCVCPVTWTAWQCQRFEGERTGTSGWIYPPQKDIPLLSTAAIASGSSLSLILLQFPLPRSVSHTVLYICHIRMPPMPLVPSPIARFSWEMCSSKHFTLAYAKRNWQMQVNDSLRSNGGLGQYWWRKRAFSLCFRSLAFFPPFSPEKYTKQTSVVQAVLSFPLIFGRCE